MSSQITIKIRVYDYIRQFTEHIYGNQPIPTNRMNKLGTLIELMLTLPPHNFNPSDEDGNIEIMLPVYSGVNIQSRNYLPRRAKAAISRRLQNDFDVTYIGFMQRRWLERNRINKKVYIIQIIEDFCIEYGVSMTGENIDMLKKKYYRYMKPMTPRRQKILSEKEV